jgi:hypothetical protein
MQFDEALGPGAGTIFGAGEDSDFVLTLMQHGVRGRFYGRMHIGHPKRPYADAANADRAIRYGGGFGYVLRKHGLLQLGIGLVAYDVLRATVYAMAGRRDRAANLWAHGRGIVRAYLRQ